MTKLTIAQRMRVSRKLKGQGRADEAGELNIVPFLDIVMNILLFILATLATVFTATIPLSPPKDDARGHSDRLSLTVIALPEGYMVGARGGFLTASCREIGPSAVAIPTRVGADANGYTHDFAGLTRCMSAARERFGEELSSAHDINVSVQGEVPYGVLVQTIDAVRERREGACHMAGAEGGANYSDPDCYFPEVTLGVIRR